MGSSIDDFWPVLCVTWLLMSAELTSFLSNMEKSWGKCIVLTTNSIVNPVNIWQVKITY